MAAFSVDDGLDGAREIELSVAPDIAVELRRKGRRLARPGDTLSAGGTARAPRFKDDGIVEVPGDADQQSASGDEPEAQGSPRPRRRPDPSVELERLSARLAAANGALEQERERRTALAKSLEEERSASRQLRTELGQARSELEVAATARAEATAVESELDDMRRQLREAQRQHESEIAALTRRHEEALQALSREHQDATKALAGDHEQVTQAHALLQDELRQKTETLDATREALAAERAETGRLHNRFTQLQKARQQGGGTSPGSGASASGSTRAAEASEAGEPRPSRRRAPRREEPGPQEPHREESGRKESSREGSRPEASRREATRREASPALIHQAKPDPSETQRFDVLGFQDERETQPAPRRSRRRSRNQTPDPPAWTPPVADRLRPLNPSLRHRTYWFGRLLALIVLCGVLAAVWVVLHSTVLH